MLSDQGAEGKNLLQLLPCSPAPLLPCSPAFPVPSPLTVHFLHKICIDITLQKLWSFHNFLMKPDSGG